MKLVRVLSVGLMGLVAACGQEAGNYISRGDDYESVVRKADDARKVGDIDSAVPLYGRALEIYPDGVEAKLGLGETYLSIGLAEQAAAMFNDVLAKRASNATARRGLARALMATGQLPLAERQLVVALQADPTDFRALNAMGVALDMQGRHAEAQVRYRAGIDAKPDYMPLRVNLGLSLAISGDYQAAIDVLAPLAAARGSDGRTRQNLALAYAMAGDLGKSLQLLRADLGERSAQQQLSYFIRLRELTVLERSVELRNNPAFFTQSGSAPKVVES